MVRIVILATAVSALAVASALAEPPAPTTQGPASAGAAAQHGDPAPSGERLQPCPKDSPTIDYRACVNAATRDPNAKIRRA